MTHEQDDPVWAAAWTWVQREFDRTAFDANDRMALAHWRAEHPAHERAYRQAHHLWSLAGNIPARTQDPDRSG
ncbi:FecR/PupR family sigma factor regulator [Roseateles amylovorans]|jgi:ferric-dicitrate binding protein FerR (iron transport regulator)|uniref:DUF4880 domain-containing protein n=1 Tax=Roseateles amylovorans TaxID=2978473 RepID=A0ABY6ASL5_9BURK|nr:DUF4880 domain-containing protein [Roseateles amylovorans]UXH76226.1 DUF4880 domain-containing protein [Roseateles amylovorans]